MNTFAFWFLCELLPTFHITRFLVCYFLVCKILLPSQYICLVVVGVFQFTRFLFCWTSLQWEFLHCPIWLTFLLSVMCIREIWLHEYYRIMKLVYYLFCDFVDHLLCCWLSHMFFCVFISDSWSLIMWFNHLTEVLPDEYVGALVRNLRCNSRNILKKT